MHGFKGVVSLLALAFSTGIAIAGDAESCRTVRMAEPGWNDLAFTTGVANVILDALGYTPKSDILGINVIYEGMKNNDVDVFLGYWNPAMVSDSSPTDKTDRSTPCAST